MIRFRWFLLLLFFAIPVVSTFSDIKIGKGVSLETLFYFKTDQDRALEEYFAMGAKVELKYKLTDNWQFKLKVDAGTDKIRVDEVWGKYKYDFWRLKFGIFENWLIIDDIISSRDNLYAEDNPVRNRLDDMGWYSPGATGFRLYRNYKGKGFPISAYSHLYMQPSSMEIQFDLGVLWAYAGEDSFLGLMFAYYPFFIHDLWIHSNDNYTQDHNFLLNAVFADFSGGFPLVYKLELTLANNLIDPVGYIHFPGDGEAGWFFGSYAYAGYPLTWEGFTWTPGLNLSMLVHELKIPESHSIAIRMGNKFEWNETFYINADLGLGFNTYYDPNLITALEVSWGITLHVRI